MLNLSARFGHRTTRKEAKELEAFSGKILLRLVIDRLKIQGQIDKKIHLERVSVLCQDEG
jgi:hypothetical protein